MKNHIDRLRGDIYREIIFWAGSNFGSATALAKYDAAHERATRMHEDVFVLEPQDFDMLSFVLRHDATPFLAGASMRDKWSYFYRRSRYNMRENVEKNLMTKLIWLCCYPH